MSYIEPNEKVIAKHRQLLDKANSKAVVLSVKNEKHPCTIAGCRLKQPHVVTKTEPPIVAELSWALVERIANGQTNEIEY